MTAKFHSFKPIFRLAAPFAAVALVVAAPFAANAKTSAHQAHHNRALLAPSNDNFATPTFLPGQSGSVSDGQFNFGATAEAGEPQHKPGVPAHASVWYRWTSPVTGRVIFRTRGSDFDTILAAYTGTTLTSLSQVATNDDTTFGDGASLQSQIGFVALRGVTYNVVVDSFNAQSTGDIRLSWTTNDDFDGAEALPSSVLNTTLVANSDNNGAGSQLGEPAHDGFQPGASVWFTWKAPDTGLARFSTFGNEYDTVLAAYTGTTVTDLTQVAQNDDAFSGTTASEITFSAAKGKTYRIALTGNDLAAGFTLIRYGVETPTLSIGNVAAGEGDSGSKSVSFVVGLSAKSASTVKVSFATANGTAAAGSDYKAKSGTLTFKPGQTSKLVSVVIFGDTTVEPLETFNVNLSNPTGGGVTILDSQGIGSIINDD